MDDELTPLPDEFTVDFQKVPGNKLRETRDALLEHADFKPLNEKVLAGEATPEEAERRNEMVMAINRAAEVIKAFESESEAIVDVPDPTPEPPAAPSSETDDSAGDGSAGDQAGDGSADDGSADDGSADDGSADGEPITVEQTKELITAALKTVTASGDRKARRLELPAPPTRDVAPMVASIATYDNDGGLGEITLTHKPMSDADFGAKVANLNSAAPGTERDLGGWFAFDPSDVKITAGMSPAQMAKVTMRNPATGRREVDPKTAAPCTPGCIRRDIADSSNMADPLDLFEEFPCDRGSVEYFRAIALSAVENGVNVWDPAAQAAFDAAWSTYQTAVSTPDTGANIAAALGAVRAAEKQFAEVACQTSDTAVVIPILVGLEMKNEVAYSQPEAVAAYRAALMRRLVRERNAQRRSLLQGFASHYRIDGQGMYPGMGAAPIVYDVLKRVMSIGSVKERISEGSYTLGIDYNIAAMLMSDENMAADRVLERFDDIFDGLAGVTVLYDAPVGVVEPFAADLPAAGAGNIVDLPGWPIGTNAHPLQIELFDTSSFDVFSLPDITATGFRSYDQYKQNRQTALVLETFEGMMKPGVEPNFTLNFENLVVTGRRSAADIDEDILPLNTGAGTGALPLDTDANDTVDSGEVV